MASDRYNKIEKTTIFSEDMHLQIKERRGLDYIDIYPSSRIEPLDLSELASLSFYEHIWARGDKLSNLAYVYYGDVNYWWIIAKINNKPTEHHCKIGDKIFIPIEVDYLSKLYGY